MKEKVCILTGAGGGIGASIAEMLFSCGYKLVLMGRDEEKLKKAAKKIESCDGMLLNTAEFEVKPEDIYVRVTITDSTGKHAYTNAYFVDDLFE